MVVCTGICGEGEVIDLGVLMEGEDFVEGLLGGFGLDFNEVAVDACGGIFALLEADEGAVCGTIGGVAVCGALGSQAVVLTDVVHRFGGRFVDQEESEVYGIVDCDLVCVFSF